ncbi:MAG: citrate/2-methylcitrate synthase [Minisyncoccia bacterium]
MNFDTKISATEQGEHQIYGHTLTGLAETATFTDAIFLLYTGKLPTPGQRPLLDAMLVMAIEHGVEAPSLYVPRISVASGNPVHVGIAAGILAIGDVHGGAGEAAAQLLARDEDAATLVQEYLSKGKRMPGFGHRTYKDEDPRASLIFKKAKEAGIPLAAFEKAYAIEAALVEAKGKKLPLNIDGAFAAATLAFGLTSPAARALFVLARVAGMGAHAIEELQQKKGYYRLGDLQG